MIVYVMAILRQKLADFLHRAARRLSSEPGSSSSSNSSHLRSHNGPPSGHHVSDSVELAASVKVLKILSAQLQSTAEDIQSSILRISSGFSGMAQQAREALQLSQCRIQSQEGMNRVLENATQTLSQVDTIAKEARIVGLNGQIEAARAGEQGVTFSVVANETKSLAFHAASTSGSLKKMLNELGDLHQGLVDALQSSENASQNLSGEISRAVMGLQFQDRVNQQIQHIVETLNVLHDNISPTVSSVASPLVDARLNDWCQWMQSRSTMESERVVAGTSGGPANDAHDSSFGSVELF